MNITEYAQKWNRDESNNFAAACFGWNSMSDLKGLTIEDADPADMDEWGINDPQEWLDAVNAALEEKTDA